MKTLRILRIIAVALALGALLAAPAFADAAQRGKRQTEKPAPLFPDATREEPDALVSKRFAKKIDAMIDLAGEDNQDEAIAAAQAIVDAPKANAYERALALQAIGYAWLDKDDYVKGIEYLQKALDANGLPNDQHYQIMFQVAQMQMAEEQYPEALLSIDRMLGETKSSKPDYLATKGNILYRMERFPEAVAVLKQAIATSDKPQQSWSQLLMASYFDMEQPGEAAKIAEELLLKNPDDPTLLLNTASIYLQADQMDKAAALLSGAKNRGLLVREQDYQQLYRVYASMDGKENETIAVINEGLEKGILKPNAEVYTALAQSYYYTDRPSEAIEAYKKGAPLAADGEVALNLARVLLSEGRAAEARQAAQQALAKGLKDPKDANNIIAGTK